MQDIDYKKLGLRIGLEIHQQLDSGHKLFCRCPIKKSDEFPCSVTRRLRPAAGELEVIDPAAIHEFLRNKKFIYKFNPDSSCLIELDESPPLQINPIALETALKISKSLGCSIVDELHVMRKTIIDGSSVSGFQRTALLATNGKIDASFGKIDIHTISIEEDSSTALQKGRDYVEYRLDRMGIPLVEIATSAEMHEPIHAKEVAETLGLLLRSYPVVRGIGSIRQDVNVSIEQGARVELKGFQELELMPKLIENEVQRQISLIEIKEELLKRGLRKIDDMPKDVTRIFQPSKTAFLQKIISSGGQVYGLKLSKFAGLLKKECGDRTFGKELSSYVEAFGFGGMIHSDEDLEKYGLIHEFDALKKELHAGVQDLVLIIAGNENLVKAMQALSDRSAQCLLGVPEETRVSEGIGSKYTRPLPGSGRLYPESDIPAIKIDVDYVASLVLPKSLKDIELDLSKQIPKEIAHQIIRSRYYPLFEEFQGFGRVMVASVFLSTFTDLKRKGFDVDLITKDHMFKIFSLAKDAKISKSSIPKAFEQLASGKDIDEVMSNLEAMPEKEVEKIVRETIKANPGKNESAIIGIVMRAVAGKADGKVVAGLIKKEMS